MSIDVAGSAETIIVSGGVQYPVREGAPTTYQAYASARPPLSVRHTDDGIVIRDSKTGTEGVGPTYLDALRAFQAARSQD